MCCNSNFKNAVGVPTTSLLIHHKNIFNSITYKICLHTYRSATLNFREEYSFKMAREALQSAKENNTQAKKLMEEQLMSKYEIYTIREIEGYWIAPIQEYHIRDPKGMFDAISITNGITAAAYPKYIQQPVQKFRGEIKPEKMRQKEEA